MSGKETHHSAWVRGIRDELKRWQGNLELACETAGTPNELATRVLRTCKELERAQMALAEELDAP